MPSEKNKNLPPVTFVKKHDDIEYYDYVGKVELREAIVGTIPCGGSVAGHYIAITDRNTGKDICEIHMPYEKEFLKYAGTNTVIRFRGKLNHGVVIPHTK